METEKPPRLIVFTDLDGTLLDGETYEYEPARLSLERLKRLGIPLVICTSKTRAEVEPLRRELANTHPFITENGGALYIPEGYFKQLPSNVVHVGPYDVIEFGTPYQTLRRALNRLGEEVGAGLRGFGDMAAEEVGELTGLTLEAAALAQKREYDEPFVIEQDGEALAKLQAAAGAAGLTVVSGGRFCHLMGGTDKGKACRVLQTLYRDQNGPATTAAFGDGLNDLPMLKAVDRPFIVEQASGGYPEPLDVPGLVRLPGRGPAGWARGIECLLQEFAPCP